MAALTVWGGAGDVRARGDGTFEAPLVVYGRPVAHCTAGDFDVDGRLDLAGATTGVVLLYLQTPIRGRWRRPPGIEAFLPHFMRAADFDDDGAADLVVADDSTAYFLRSKRDGTFEERKRLPESSPGWLAVADFDGDGSLDLAVADAPLRAVNTYSGRGGDFSLLKSYHFLGEPHAVEAMEYDGDGRIDLLVGLARDGNLPLRGMGDGNFEEGVLIPQFPCADSIATGDFNRDGLGDLAIGCVGSPASWSVNLGNGAFGVPQSALPGWGVYSMAVADWNGDSLEDIAVTGNNLRTLFVHPGKGDGTFLPPVEFHSTGIKPSFLTAADLDGDGLNEAVSAGQFSSSLNVFWGRSGGRFLESASLISGFDSAAAMNITDLDLDGAPDLLVSNSKEASVSLYRGPGRGSPSAPSTVLQPTNLYGPFVTLDLDGDATPDLAGVGANPSIRSAAIAILEPSGVIRSEKSFRTGLWPTAITAGRIDGDARIDLAVACSAGFEVDLFLSVGGGDFAPAPAVPTGGIIRKIFLAHLDGDGLADMALAAEDQIVVHFARGGGDFTEPLILPQRILRRLGTGGLATADLDADGRVDLISSDGARISLFRSEADRRFELAQDVLMIGINSLGAADLDGDGTIEVTAVTADSVAIFSSASPARVGYLPRRYSLGINAFSHLIADLDRDGALDIVALAPDQAMALFGRSIALPNGQFIRGDADGNRDLTMNDVLVVLNHLFLGSGALPCDDAADSNDDGEVSLSDPIATLDRLFLGGEVLPPPGPAACGDDPTADALPGCGAGC